jgi:hypothetical protein
VTATGRVSTGGGGDGGGGYHLERGVVGVVVVMVWKVSKEIRPWSYEMGRM